MTPLSYVRVASSTDLIFEKKYIFGPSLLSENLRNALHKTFINSYSSVLDSGGSTLARDCFGGSVLRLRFWINLWTD